ncbi:MAG: hypothetical protein D6799_06465 [Bacteroidetes bacterium]|nr:MAG: hypothetical protein D6799_06465 [Bacteroidota bacterium]
MINCRKYTRYLHKSEVVTLKWYEKALMNYHYWICKFCKKYTQENEYLNHWLATDAVEVPFFQESEMEEIKNKILEKIK